MKNILVLILLFQLGCSSSKIADDLGNVSLIAVVANPEKYHNKKITISGYFIVRHEENVIYINEVDFKNKLYKNGIWIGLNKEFLDSQNIQLPYEGYITVNGTFKQNDPKTVSNFSGRLTDINWMFRIEE
jgi:hypothetical protein